MIELVFAAGQYSRMARELLAFAPNEAAAFALAGVAQTPSRTRLLIREYTVVPPGAYNAQSPDHLEISPIFIAQHLKRARGEGWSLIAIHTHPFSRDPRFSVVDDAGERLLVPTLFERAPGGLHGSLVIGTHGCEGRVYVRRDGPQHADRVLDVGSQREVIHEGDEPDENPMALGRNDRSIRALGVEGQRRLAGLRVGIVGLGGTGSIVAEQLAHLGIGSLTLLDFDSVEETNLNRVVGARAGDVGKPKVRVGASMIRRINKNVGITARRGSVNTRKDGSVLLDVDVLFCCTDSHGSRAVLNQLAYQYHIPVIDLGVRIDVGASGELAAGGRLQLLAPGLPCLVCQRLLDSAAVRRELQTEAERQRDPYIVGEAVPQPAVISLNGVVSSLAVTMFLSVVAGLAVDSRHQIYLPTRGVVRAIQGAAASNCVVCSPAGALGRGDSWPLPWRLD